MGESQKENQRITGLEMPKRTLEQEWLREEAQAGCNGDGQESGAVSLE